MMDTIIIAFAPGALEKATGVEHPENIIMDVVKKRIPNVDFYVKIEQPPDGNLVDVLYTSNKNMSGELILLDVLWCVIEEIKDLVLKRAK